MDELKELPFKYLKIRWHNGDNQPFYGFKKDIDWIWPIKFATYATLIHAIFLILGATPFFLNEKFSIIISSLQILPGFYIASLAALGALQKTNFLDCSSDTAGDKDQDIPSGGPIAEIAGNWRNMSRRRFLANALTHISLLCFLSIFFIFLIQYLYSSNILLVTSFFYYIGILIVGWITIFLISQMLTITLMILYYLGDRAYRK